MTDEFLKQSKLCTTARITVLILAVGLIVAWKWTPLGDYLAADRLLELSQYVRQLEISPLTVMPCLTLACILMVPLSWIVVLSGLLFGLWWGFIYAFLIGLISGLLGFILGRFLGQDMVRRFATRRVHNFSAVLGKHGISAAIALRVIPFAPFTVQNMLAGASNIKQRDFNIGNAIGLVPSTLFILLVMAQLESSLQSPGLKSVVGLILVVVAMVTVVSGLRYWFTKDLGPLE